MNEEPHSEAVRELLEAVNPEALTADGFDEALIGVLLRPGRPAVACYDRNKCLELLAAGFEADEQEDEYGSETAALEYFEFNVIGAYVGENTPVFADVRW